MQSVYVRARRRRVLRLRKRRESAAEPDTILSPELRAISGFFEHLILICVVFICIFCVGTHLLHIEPRIVLSGSMEPAIPTGSICLVDKDVPMDEVEIGDVIAFFIDEQTMVIHRTIRKHVKGIETQGDANDVSDGISATEDTYAGMVVLSIPVIGYVFMAIRKFRWFVAAGVLICWMLALEMGK